MTDHQPPAPETDVLVRNGGNGDVFIRFADENRRVELLNKDDARELFNQLGNTEAIDDE